MFKVLVALGVSVASNAIGSVIACLVIKKLFRGLLVK